MALELSQSLSFQSDSNLYSQNNPNKVTRLVKSPSSSPASSSTFQIPNNASCTSANIFSKLLQEATSPTNSKTTSMLLKSSYSSKRQNKRNVELKFTNIYASKISLENDIKSPYLPSIERDESSVNRLLPQFTNQGSTFGDRQKRHFNFTSSNHSLKKTKQYRSFSEPFIKPDGAPENKTYNRCYSVILNGGDESFKDTSLLALHVSKPFDGRTSKEDMKPVNGKIGNSKPRNLFKNTPKLSKAPNAAIQRNSTKIIHSSTTDTKKVKKNKSRPLTKRKINQATQMELSTREVETQTDFDESVTDQPVTSRKQNSTSKIIKSKKTASYCKKKTVVIPFSFNTRTEEFMQRKKQRYVQNEIKYEMKKWARPALILKRKPFKIVFPAEKKRTVPISITLETDIRQQKWQKYVEEFNKRQEKLRKEKKRREQMELKNYRKMLTPKINIVPNKTLKIKPTQYCKKQEQAAILCDYESLNLFTSTQRQINKRIDGIINEVHRDNQNKFKNKKNRINLEHPKQNKNKTKKSHKQLSATMKIESNSISRENFPAIDKNLKNIDCKSSARRNMVFDKKNDSNIVKITKLSSFNRNAKGKIPSLANEDNTRKNTLVSIKNISFSGSLTIKDEFDGLQEKFSTPPTSPIHSKKQYKPELVQKKSRAVYRS